MILPLLIEKRAGSLLRDQQGSTEGVQGNQSANYCGWKIAEAIADSETLKVKLRDASFEAFTIPYTSSPKPVSYGSEDLIEEGA